MAVTIEVKIGKKVLENRVFEVVPRKGEIVVNSQGEPARVVDVVHRHVDGKAAQVGIVIKPLSKE